MIFIIPENKRENLFIKKSPSADLEGDCFSLGRKATKKTK